ncbi:MAG: hypothetical protein H0W40_03490 [Methylibium sp.]|uniref:hypothetical protein n=1 Tax=Methylibium sp. TaxID=2067992 RepID=UPI00184B5CAB|nr:hypothetical protein [Methylibium sp.]MBA3596427.1 hypothetical protein [Methylibium sp.]
MATGDKLTKREVKAFHDACAAEVRGCEKFTLELLTGDSTSRIVAVSRDGMQCCYDASFGGDWIGQFLEDLRAGCWQ